MTEGIIGFLAGAAGGMGIGGGGILLLYLTAFCGESQLSSQGTNLLFFLFTAPFALLGHLKNGFVKWREAFVSVVFGSLGVFLGFFAAQRLEGEILRLCFGAFLVFVGGRELFRKG